jgi:electron transport complex protein RnfD
MGNMLIALLPVTIFGVVLFGLYALLNVVTAVLFAELAEFAFRKITKQDMRNADLSAAVSGLLLALVIPPTMPLWMTALGAVFAIVVAKEFFGGLGANVFNPALAGRAFLMMSFPAAMTTWAVAGQPFMEGFTVDTVTGATPLVAIDGASGSSPQAWNLFIGWHGGCTGETSALLILAGFFYLLVTKTIDWRAPVTMIATTFVFSWILGVDPLLAILAGGLLFGAVFMTTDYTSAPVTPMGKVIFGFGCGIITVLIRCFGSYPEGVSYSILIMNMVTPFLNRIVPKKYGFVPKTAGGAK